MVLENFAALQIFRCAIPTSGIAKQSRTQHKSTRFCATVLKNESAAAFRILRDYIQVSPERKSTIRQLPYTCVKWATTMLELAKLMLKSISSILAIEKNRRRDIFSFKYLLCWPLSSVY